jgi:23S rRNA pseudouridine1911/1915/1917 synthase
MSLAGVAEEELEFADVAYESEDGATGEVVLSEEQNSGEGADSEPSEFDDSDEIKIYDHHVIQVDPKQEALRIDVFLAARLANLTRSRIKLAAEAGFVRVNEQPVKVSYKIRPRDLISIALPYPPAPDLKPEPIPLNITYEDDDLLLINKPPGLVCHPGVGNYSGTLINGLLYYFNEHVKLPAGEAPESIRPGLVHRIDKDTSGLLVIAKNERAFTLLARQFFVHSTERLYIALVWGNVAEDAGTITGDIARNPLDRKRYIVTDKPGEGKHAVTHFRVLQRYGIATLVECKLETGRTHQIRVHFKTKGHTLFSDVWYGGNRILRGKPSNAYKRFIQECFELMPRQGLHARTLGFEHPTTGTRMHFSSPIPADFRAVILRMCQFMKLEPIAEIFEEPVNPTSALALPA